MFDKLLLPLVQHTRAQSRGRRSKRTVSDFTSWTEAWNRYLCSRLTFQPSMALELYSLISDTYCNALLPLSSHILP